MMPDSTVHLLHSKNPPYFLPCYQLALSKCPVNIHTSSSPLFFKYSSQVMLCHCLTVKLQAHSAPSEHGYTLCTCGVSSLNPCFLLHLHHKCMQLFLFCCCAVPLTWSQGLLVDNISWKRPDKEIQRF